MVWPTSSEGCFPVNKNGGYGYLFGRGITIFFLPLSLPFLLPPCSKKKYHYVCSSWSVFLNVGSRRYFVALSFERRNYSEVWEIY